MGEDLLLNDRFKCVMDGEYYNRLASIGKKFTYLPVVLADFRLHGDNISQKHLGKNGIDQALSLQLQYAESRAIRRTYGVKLFQCENLNSVIDCGLAYFFRGLKWLLKLMNKPRVAK